MAKFKIEISWDGDNGERHIIAKIISEYDTLETTDKRAFSQFLAETMAETIWRHGK